MFHLQNALKCFNDKFSDIDRFDTVLRILISVESISALRISGYDRLNTTFLCFVKAVAS